jgi:hypothetical protein
MSHWRPTRTRPGWAKIRRWLSVPYLEGLIRYQIESQDGRWRLQFDFDSAA